MNPRLATLIVRRRALEGSSRVAGDFESVALAPRFLAGIAADSLGTFCVSTADPVFALTYDDGPHPHHTPRILDALAAHGAHATFFVLAGPAAAHPEIVRRIVEQGHEIALHGADHRSLLEQSTRDALRAISDSRRLVEDIAGVPVRLYRPPYGQHTLAQARAVHRRGLDLVVWSGDARDWLHDLETAIVDRAWDAIFPGAILLLHDDRADPETMAPADSFPSFDRAVVTDELLNRARSSGFRAVSAGELLSRYPRVKSLARERGRR